MANRTFQHKQTEESLKCRIFIYTDKLAGHTVTEYQVKDILKVRNIKCRYKWLVVVAVSETPMSEAK
jgi:hypothetical protein